MTPALAASIAGLAFGGALVIGGILAYLLARVHALENINAAAKDIKK